MGIYFDASNRTFYLNSSGCTYAFGINRLGFPEHLHFGAPVGNDLTVGIFDNNGRIHPTGRFDENGVKYDPCFISQEICTPYGGDFYEPSLVVEFPNGNRRVDLAYAGHEILEEKPMPEGMPGIRKGQTLALYLTGKELRVTLFYTVSDTTATVVRSMKVENLGAEPIRVERAYSYCLELPHKPWKAVYLSGAQAIETQWTETELTRGVFSIGTRRGVSSSAFNPFLAITDPSTTEDRGEAYGMHLVYSGSWDMTAELTPVHHLRLTGGLSAFDFSWLLESGESFRTPEVVLAYSENGLNGLSRQYHDLYRQALIPERFVKKPRPVLINNWEGTRFNFDGEKLKAIVSKVAGTGIDTFVLDDGWFGKRDDGTSGLGDWFVNEKKLGGPLSGIIEHARQNGMKFGLWFEPEMVNPDSDLYRAHPDWAIQTPDEVPCTCRDQLMLDLTRPEVRDYLADTVNRIIRDNKLDYVKWDANRDLSEGYSLYLPRNRQKELHHRYVLGFYDLCHRIIEANPDVLFEACASGGNRYDPGILYYFPQTWISDQTDAPARTRIQYGASLCYPLSTMSCHITEVPNRRAKHLTPFQSRAHIAHLGATGYELDTTKLTDSELAAIPRQIADYHSDEDLVLEGDVYRVLNPKAGSNHFAMMLVSKDKSKGKLTVMQLLEHYNAATVRLYPKGLDEIADYYCPELDRTCRGSTWLHWGILPDFPQGDYNTLVYHFYAVVRKDES